MNVHDCRNLFRNVAHCWRRMGAIVRCNCDIIDELAGCGLVTICVYQLYRSWGGWVNVRDCRDLFLNVGHCWRKMGAIVWCNGTGRGGVGAVRYHIYLLSVLLILVFVLK